jgi:hypothetical protein
MGKVEKSKPGYQTVLRFRIRKDPKLLQDLNPDLEVLDSDPDPYRYPKQEMHLIKNYLKIIKNKQFDSYDI